MKNEESGKVEMPVAMAMMLAQNGQAITSFASLDTQRRNEYIRRAQHASSREEMRSVIEDIIKIG